ncbi:hypothetical protein HK102_004688 [Quaeritorhiza haematococci]|nr:hypothetical protein HK102_004688 [Quaeritorhiza haematococci]
MLSGSVPTNAALRAQIWEELQQRPQPSQDAPLSVDSPFDPNHPDIQSLPPVAKRFITHAITPGATPVSAVKLHQNGEFSPNFKTWATISAQQILRSGVGYVWNAQLTFIPILFTMTGGDFFYKSKGSVDFRIFGGWVPFVSSTGVGVNFSAMQRLLAESVFVPGSILPQCGCVWKDLDSTPLTTQVTLPEGIVKSVLDVNAREEVKQVLKIDPMDPKYRTLTVRINKDGSLKEVTLQRWRGSSDNPDVGRIDTFGVRLSGEFEVNGIKYSKGFVAGWKMDEAGKEEIFFKAEIVKLEPLS